jgi:hypothetical protein
LRKIEAMNSRILMFGLLIFLAAASVLLWRTLSDDAGPGVDLDAEAAAGLEERVRARRARDEGIRQPRAESADGDESKPRTTDEKAEAAREPSDPDHRDRDPWFEFRVLDEQGKPLANLAIWGFLRYREEATGNSVVVELLGSALRTGVSTDSLGIARTLIEGNRRPRELEELFVEGRRSGELGALLGRLRPRVSESRGRIQLGDLVMKPRPLIVSGRIIDQDRKPLVGANLQIWRPRDPRDYGTGFLRQGSQSSADPLRDWRQVNGMHLDNYGSGDDGRFIIRGLIDDPRRDPRIPSGFEGRLKLSVADPYVTFEPRDFNLGASNLEIVVARRGLLSLQVRVPQDPQAPDLVLDISPTSPADAPPTRIKLGPNGRVLDLPLDAGVYDLRLLNSDQTLALEVPNVAIESGGKHDLGILDPDALNVYEVRAETADGTPIKSFTLRLARGANDQANDTPPFMPMAREGVVSFTSARESLAVTILDPQYSAVPYGIEPGRRLLVALPRPTVEVQIRGVPQLARGESLRVRLRSRAADGVESSLSLPLSRRGVASGTLPHPGVWRADLLLKRGERTAPLANPTIVGEIGATESLLECTWDSNADAALQAALSALNLGS